MAVQDGAIFGRYDGAEFAMLRVARLEKLALSASMLTRSTWCGP
jgi:hypothetical protein